MEIQLSFQLKVDITKYVYDTNGEKSMRIVPNVKKIPQEIVNQTTESLFRLPNQFINDIFGTVTILERQTKYRFPYLNVNIKLRCEETVELTDMNIDCLIDDMANFYDYDCFEVGDLINGMMTEYAFQVVDIPTNIKLIHLLRL